MGDDMEVQRFWIIYSKDGGGQTIPGEFSNYHAAVKECDRIAGLHPDCVFIVMESVAARTAVIRVCDLRIAGDKA